MKYIKGLFTFLIISIILSCASGSTIITGNVREAIDPNDVKIYLDPPKRFETIGIVEATSDVEFSRQSAQDRVISELKKQAAKIGANGVLLTDTGSQTGQSVGMYFYGFIYSSRTDTIIGQGRAIYVFEE